MARYSGGPVTHRALDGARSKEPQELLYTLRCIVQVRGKIDQSELAAVRGARQAGISWTEIAAALGISRQAAWERWRELDEAGTRAHTG
jgi:DNA invertase Pin-like site-specific DNA recombinase